MNVLDLLSGLLEGLDLVVQAINTLTSWAASASDVVTVIGFVVAAFVAALANGEKA